MNKHQKPETRNPKLGTLFQDARGVSMIEVLMASAVFIVAMLAILGMQMTAMHGAKYGNQMVVASTLASDKLEDLMRITPLDPDFGPQLGARLESAALHEDNINEEGNTPGPYTRYWWVTDNLNPALQRVTKTIFVKVTWRDAWGVNREVRMSYLYYIMPA